MRSGAGPKSPCRAPHKSVSETATYTSGPRSKLQPAAETRDVVAFDGRGERVAEVVRASLVQTGEPLEHLLDFSTLSFQASGEAMLVSKAKGRRAKVVQATAKLGGDHSYRA